MTEATGSKSVIAPSGAGTGTMWKSHVREYGLLGSLLVIMIFFQVVTGTARSRVYGLVVPAAATVVQPVAQPPATSVSYANCTAARNAGAAPVLRGEPGYGRHLDRDDDGIGCE